MESLVKYPIRITLDEQKVLTKFQDLIKSKKLEYNTSLFEDSYRIRFIRARKMDLNKSFEMFNNYIKCCKDYNVDNIDVNIHKY
jgi:hypothetical protein